MYYETLVKVPFNIHNTLHILTFPKQTHVPGIVLSVLCIYPSWKQYEVSTIVIPVPWLRKPKHRELFPKVIEIKGRFKQKILWLQNMILFTSLNCLITGEMSNSDSPGNLELRNTTEINREKLKEVFQKEPKF